MNHYEDLVERLRTGTGLPLLQGLMNEAADAIEEFDAVVALSGSKPAQEFILAAAVAHFGRAPQMLMVLEEMSELQKEICKNFRGKENEEEIAEEIADVEIMLDQLKMIFKVENKVTAFRTAKIKRLRERIEATE